jgi:amidohydrolase
MKRYLVGIVLGLAALNAWAELDSAVLDRDAAAIEPRLLDWRRDFHQHPELGNREFRTSKIVADHLKALGLEVHAGIAHTGVAAVLRGGRPGPTIALRADMDALPVTEQVDLPFKSTVTTEYRGQPAGVMHACGHDAHTAILMSSAEILAAHRDELPGTILFIFQPAEEGAPEGEQGGAPLMLAEGLFDIARPEAIFGLHVMANAHAGVIGYKPGPFMAGSDFFKIVVRGKQTHGARPWDGVDPIVVASQIVIGLQTIVSRQLDIADVPAIVTIGAIKGGVRHNIIPDEVEMLGTFRTFRPDVREDVLARIRRTAEDIAASAGATAELTLGDSPNPATINDVELTRRMVPVLERVAPGKVRAVGLQTVSEDFAYYGREVPSMFFYVGVASPDANIATTPANHSPLFRVEESGLLTGLRAMLGVAVDYLERGPSGGEPAR